MFDQIEKLKQELTDKYVIVDANVPELMRFGGIVGQVKTVNMNGRALVQFDAWSNIGWYDIDVDSLKVVPKPAEVAEGKKHEAKAEATPKAAAKPAPTAGEKKLSPLEMARMQGAAKSGPASPPAGEKSAPKPGSKPSTADILAAARAKKDGAPSVSTAAPPQEEAPVATAPAQAAVASPKPATSKPALVAGQRPSVPEILAWCRQHDAK